MDPAVRPIPAPRANDNDEPELQQAWRDHCLHMAEATDALAQWCGDVEMMNAYLDLAARWRAQAGDELPRA